MDGNELTDIGYFQLVGVVSFKTRESNTKRNMCQLEELEIYAQKAISATLNFLWPNNEQ